MVCVILASIDLIPIFPMAIIMEVAVVQFTQVVIIIILATLKLTSIFVSGYFHNTVDAGI